MSGQQGWSAPNGWGPPASPPPPEPAPSPAAPATPPPTPPAFDVPPGWGGPAAAAAPGWGPRPPEVKPGVVPLRPLGLGELLDGAVGVVRRYPRPALGMSAAVALVQTVLGIFLLVTAFDPLLTLDPAALETGDTAQLEAALGGLAAGGTLGVVLTLLASAVLTGVITAVVGKAVLGQPFSLGEAWSQVRPVVLRLVGLAVLVMLAVTGALTLLIVVGVLLVVALGPVGAVLGVPLVLSSFGVAAFLYIRWSLAPCALVLERVGVLESMRRSRVLVKGDWWRVFGILLLTFVIAQFVSQVVQIPFLAVGASPLPGIGGGDLDSFGTREVVLSSIGGGIAATLVAPFTAGVRALLYVDRRMRAEGLDVALTAAAAAPGSSPSA